MVEGLLSDFLTRALIAGGAVALVAGPLGCLVIWRRMAFFGATLAHSALLGLALGFLLDINLTFGLIAAGGAVALLLVVAEGRPDLATDTLLSILAHGALAAGLIALAFIHGIRVDLMGYLFGDILGVRVRDVYVIGAVAIVALGVTAVLWRSLLRVSIHAEMAAVEGVPVLAVRVGFMLLLAVVVAVALKVVGILLVTSLLVMPAAAARPFARTPEAMAVIAAVIGLASVAGGIAGSYAWDLPAGAAIVSAALIVFVLSRIKPAPGSGVRRT
jgi:zinc transport system permease protein